MNHIRLSQTLVLLLSIFMLLFIGCTEEKVSPYGSGTIEGMVLEEPGLDPIPDAEVYTYPASHIVMTDSTGSFRLENLEAGEYKVIAKKSEYFSSTTGIKVNLNSVTHVTIRLDKRTMHPDLPAFTDSFFPENHQNSVSVSTNISWQLQELHEGLEFRLRLYETGHSYPYVDRVVADTFAVVNGLKFGTTYWWQVSAVNSAGLTNSDIQIFTTNSFPHDFLLYSKKVDGVSQIFVTDLELSNNIRITYNNYHSWRPVANPQRNRIAFISTRDITPQLYTMDLNGGNIKRVTTIPTGGFYNKGVGFSWLPDGERLVFTAYNNLYVINHDGTGRRLLTSIPEGRHFRDVDWSPVDNKIVAITMGENYYDAEILLMDTNGSNREVLLDSIPGALGDPVFSIDGNDIIYSRDVSEYTFDNRRQLDARIFRYNLRTGEITDLSGSKASGTNDLFPQYTRDGSRVFFINTRNTIGARKDLWIIHLNRETSGQREELVRDVVSDDLP